MDYNNEDIIKSLKSLDGQKKISRDVIKAIGASRRDANDLYGAMEKAIRAAYIKKYGPNDALPVEISRKTGEIHVNGENITKNPTEFTQEAVMAAKNGLDKEINKSELIMAIEELEREKQISADSLFTAIEESIKAACRRQFTDNNNTNVNARVEFDRTTGAVAVYSDYDIVKDEEVESETSELTVAEAEKLFPGRKIEVGDVVSVEVTPKDFGRIAAQAAKQAIIQKIREEERAVLVNKYKEMEHTVITGTVSRFFGKNISVNLGKCDGVLSEGEQIKGEKLRIGSKVKVYVVDVGERVNARSGPSITLSRSHPELVKKLFAMEVIEIERGTVEIMGLSREAGARTKLAVRSNDPDVDPIGACIGPNTNRVDAIVSELGGEKIDIIAWSENPEIYIKNALSPAKVISVRIDSMEKIASVVVADSQLSLAIGREGQNARLAARLTGYKIDIMSESQAIAAEEAAYAAEEYDETEAPAAEDIAVEEEVVVLGDDEEVVEVEIDDDEEVEEIVED